MRLIAVACVFVTLAGCLPKDKIADARPDESSFAEATADRPAFRVVLPDAPKAWEKTAAEELEHYLRLCLGENRMTVEGKDAVVFHVGDGAFADEEWSIHSEGRDVFLSGGGTRGTLCAV